MDDSPFFWCTSKCWSLVTSHIKIDTCKFIGHTHMPALWMAICLFVAQCLCRLYEPLSSACNDYIRNNCMYVMKGCISRQNIVQQRGHSPFLGPACVGVSNKCTYYCFHAPIWEFVVVVVWFCDLTIYAEIVSSVLKSFLPHSKSTSEPTPCIWLANFVFAPRTKCGLINVRSVQSLQVK